MLFARLLAQHSFGARPLEQLRVRADVGPVRLLHLPRAPGRPIGERQRWRWPRCRSIPHRHRPRHRHPRAGASYRVAEELNLRAGRGVTRDVLLSEIPAVLRSDVYAVVALAGVAVGGLCFACA